MVDISKEESGHEQERMHNLYRSLRCIDTVWCILRWNAILSIFLIFFASWVPCTLFSYPSWKRLRDRYSLILIVWLSFGKEDHLSMRAMFHPSFIPSFRASLSFNPGVQVRKLSTGFFRRRDSRRIILVFRLPVQTYNYDVKRSCESQMFALRVHSSIRVVVCMREKMCVHDLLCILCIAYFLLITEKMIMQIEKHREVDASPFKKETFKKEIFRFFMSRFCRHKKWVVFLTFFSSILLESNSPSFRSWNSYSFHSIF